MTVIQERMPATPRLAPRGEGWLEDLHWHKRMFGGSRLQWNGEHVLSIVTRYTGGQLEFTTVSDLETLRQYQTELRGYRRQCWLAMAEPLGQARDVFGGSWTVTCTALGLSEQDCEAAVQEAVGEPPAARTNANVERTLRELPFANPLIEAWELKQLCAMYEAAGEVFEDAICDLADELDDGRPLSALMCAAGAATPAALRLQVEQARTARGKPGDPRRIPTQIV